MKLEGKVAIVTGAGRGIGRAIALAFAREGADVVVISRTFSEVEETAGQIRALGRRALPLKVDISAMEDVENMVKSTLEEFGRIDILVNNASVFLPGRLKQMSFEDLRLHIQVNAWVPLVLSREFARLAKRGKIINLLDARIKGYDFLHVPYILSKHLLSILTKMMALEFAPEVTVNGIAPGLILPPPGKDKRYLERLMQTVPLKRHGNPDDIANAVIYLLKNDFITGQIINVDGGLHLKGYGNGPNPDK